MRSVLLFVLIMILAACKQQESAETSGLERNTSILVQYPTTEKVYQEDDYFGTIISDPYRWLEVDTAEDVAKWVKHQNKATFGYLEQINYREAIEKRYADLYDYPKLSSPFKAGEYYFFYKKEGLQNQFVIYYQKGLEGKPEVFLDSNTYSEDGTTALYLSGFSKDFKYVAISQTNAGSDWREIRVMEVATKKELSDQLKWVKFSGASWYKDGFFYSRYPEPQEGTELSASNKFHSVFYHKLGTPQSEDELVYRDDAAPNMYHNVSVTEDERYLILYARPGTDGFATYCMNLEGERNWRVLFKGYKNKSQVVKHLDGEFLVLTDIGAPKYRLIKVDAENPDPSGWEDVIPEKEHLLQSVSSGGKQLFANYLKDATDRFYQMNYDGTNIREIELPVLGSASGFNGREEDDVLFYSFSSFTYPSTIFKYDIKTGATEQFFKNDLKFNPEDYTETQVFFESKDGTKVPMFLVHRKDIELNGLNPTYLYGYGGFNVSLTPSFNPSSLILLENGGVFAMVNLRGGGEYGEDWHKAGMLLNKQNVFDDFIAAAEHLITEGYTSSSKLAIAGGSNGGLLVGACMTQRPELYAAAFPAVGVMDMLRYHKFTVGKGWIPEYGCADSSKVHFENLRSYSPLHNLKSGIKYPATLITTADHDDRVVPAHSFKFAAQLQEVHTGDEPVLIRIETDAGHGAGKPTSKIIEEQADKWAFFFYNTNSPVKYLVD